MSRPALLGRLAALTVLAAAWLFGVAGPAAAHPALISSSPGAGYAVTEPPRQITLAFNEPVTLPDRPLVVRDDRGDAVPVQVSGAPGGAALMGTPTTALPVGGYAVTYRVVGQDGDLISGTFAFGVATPVSAAGSASGGGLAGAGEAVPAATTLLRALLFLGVALALGGGWLAWRVDDATGGLPGVRPWLRVGSLLGLAAAIGLLVDLRGVRGVFTSATAPGVGRLLALQAVLLAVAVLLARRPAHGAAAGLMLLLVVAVEGLRAHPGEVSGILGAALTITHFLAGALWLGGLVHVLRLAGLWRSRPKAVQVAARTYARNALVLFVLVTLTGTISAITLLPTVQDWTSTTYGRLLLVKIAAFLVVVTLALAGRARLRPRDTSAAAGDAPVRRPFGRPAVVETALLASVVLAAAAVTTVTPARLVPVSSLLAAPVGPTVRVAERVGQVTVAVVASQGRVELRADVPDDGRPAAVDLNGELTTAGGAKRPLKLERCGPSCWTASTAWQPGTNTLALDVTAERFEAGPASVAVPWPAVPAPGLLRQVQEAMGARTAIDTVETVTSGFGTVIPHRSRRTGQEFLTGQPWAEGGAADATVVEQDGRRALLFALPALGYHFAMQLDDQNRIVSERIVTPNHLLTRQYRYR